ncbi:MAG TPA: tautomerase family protein, partial [Arthrobacter sp.]
MPLVRIDVNQGRSAEGLRRLSRGIHDAILAEYKIPERDYFHVLTEHPQ